jgi:hypothetical protein
LPRVIGIVQDGDALPHTVHRRVAADRTSELDKASRFRLELHHGELESPGLVASGVLLHRDDPAVCATSPLLKLLLFEVDRHAEANEGQSRDQAEPGGERKDGEVVHVSCSAG